jgi:hypothetical protein
VLLGCGAAPAKRTTGPVEEAPAQTATEVTGVVQEAYGSLGHGNREGILPLLADDVYAIGPGAADLVQARSDVVIALTAMFPAEKKHRMSSHALPAVVARTAPGGEAAVDVFKDGAAHPARLVDQLADGPDVVAIGPGPRDLVRGGAAIHKAWKKALKKKPYVHVVGGVRAGVTPDGQLVWIHANIERAQGDGAAVPLRAFYVYTHDGASWRLAVVHEASAAPAAPH